MGANLVQIGNALGEDVYGDGIPILVLEITCLVSDAGNGSLAVRSEAGRQAANFRGDGVNAGHGGGVNETLGDFLLRYKANTVFAATGHPSDVATCSLESIFHLVETAIR